MLHGVIVENSLTDVSILKSIHIIKSWTDGSWKLHEVELQREDAIQLSAFITEGPWYMHFWNNEDAILVVFKNKFFDIKQSDTSTWNEAVAYGKDTGIPTEQLDFLTH